MRSERRSREFLSYAAHQLRTPITSTRATAEALLLQGASHEQEDLLSALHRARSPRYAAASCESAAIAWRNVSIA